MCFAWTLYADSFFRSGVSCILRARAPLLVCVIFFINTPDEISPHRKPYRQQLHTENQRDDVVVSCTEYCVAGREQHTQIPPIHGKTTNHNSSTTAGALVCAVVVTEHHSSRVSAFVDYCIYSLYQSVGSNIVY